ncbi:MAG TPA: alpha/beta hydrolase [Burkholderiaceae bacterium]|jgi:3-oxoadipate enol-lactonase
MPSINIRGFNCHYEYQELNPSNPTVLFLNGIMNAVDAWKPAAKAVQKLGFNALCYEYRGQWRSQVTPGPYSMHDHREDLKALLDAFHIEKAHFVGTSYGGMVAMPFAAMNPARVASLVLIATSARIRPPSYDIVKGWRDLAEEGDAANLFVKMVPNLFSERSLRENPDLASTRAEGMKNALRNLPDFCRGQVLLHDAHYLEMLGDGVTSQLKNIDCQTLVVSAEQDSLYPPLDSSYIAHHIAEAEHVIVAEAGHAVVAEKPAIINSLICGHLASFI